MDKFSQAAKLLGAKGGSARVPKGFAKMTKKQRKEMSQKAAQARWTKRKEAEA